MKEERPEPRWAIPLALALGSLLPALVLPEAVLADSLTLRIKERCLSLLEILHPSQTELINPYYRPLFLLLSGLFDRVLGLGDLGLRLLASLCHLAAMAGLAALGRSLGAGRGSIALAVLLFGVLPGNVFTVAWPVVAYWTLAAALVYAALALWLRALRSGRLAPAIAGTSLAVLSLGSSQTAYHLVALAPWLCLVAPLSEGGPAWPARAAGPLARRVRWALVLWLPMLAAVAAQLLLLETGAQGLATERDPWEIAQRVAHTALPFWTAPFGAEWGLGGRGAWIAIGLTALCSLGAGRRGLFLLGFGVLAPLPFAALGHSERYAYFASGALALWAAQAWCEGLPALGARLGAGGGRGAAWLGRGVLCASALLAALAARHRLEESRAAARITGRLTADLREHRSLLDDLDRLAFVNLPPMMKWQVFDLLGVDDREELERRWSQFHNPSFFATDHAFFHYGFDLSAQYEHILECDGERLHPRNPARPMGDRTPLSPPWFLAESYETVDFPADAGVLERLDGMKARTRSLREPHRHVLLERPPPGLGPAPLPTSGAIFRFEPEAPASPGSRSDGVRLPGRLVVELDLPRPGLLVVVTYFGAEDPVHRVDGDVNRFCRHIEARIDGQPVPVEPVFFHCTGVVVPAGRHELIVQQRQPGAAPALGGDDA